MRWTRLTALLGLLPVCGCTLVSRAVYNTKYDHTLRADLEERSGEHGRLAQDAWLAAWATSAGGPPEPGFADGFVDGFADYLDFGGVGGPPAVPPNQFRFDGALSPEGHRTAARYADGFAAGAAAARASGLRTNALVPVFVPPAAGDPLPPAAAGPPLPAPPGPASRPAVLPPPGEVGPPPREAGVRPAGWPAARAVPSANPERSPDDTRVLAPAGP
jgi:hypothetical protein